MPSHFPPAISLLYLTITTITCIFFFLYSDYSKEWEIFVFLIELFLYLMSFHYCHLTNKKSVQGIVKDLKDSSMHDGWQTELRLLMNDSVDEEKKKILNSLIDEIKSSPSLSNPYVYDVDNELNTLRRSLKVNYRNIQVAELSDFNSQISTAIRKRKEILKMKDLCKRKDLSYLTFEGRAGFLTEDVCRLVTIINNQRIYNYTKKIYQDRIKEEYLRLREGEDDLELKGADLVKFQLENPSVKVRKRKSLKFWFDSSVEKIRTYKSLEDEERDIEKLKSPYFYKSNLTRDLSNFSTRRYTFQNNQVQFLYKEISFK